ncbi:hypothetical protein VTJ83DRAFT_4381 [Remersonia thermophila]|uniref:Uncharacterized protein n=1 Tax=Remersonia thermophila TaxID=72144 RepID=A0ABR4DBV1_9PEZI
MAEPETHGEKAGLRPLPAPSSPYVPSPLTPNGAKPRLGPRRQSRFTEDMVDHSTPAASISERSLDYYWYGRSAEDVNSNATAALTITAAATAAAIANASADPPSRTNTQEGNGKPRVYVPELGPYADQEKPGPWDRRTWLRFTNSTLHFFPAIVLVLFYSITISMVSENPIGYRRGQGILVIACSGADMVLDTYIMLRARNRWSGWALAARVLFGMGYVAALIWIALSEQPFPDSHTYWGLPANAAAPFVYAFLSVLGIWNFLHIPVSRFGLGTRLFLGIEGSDGRTNGSDGQHLSAALDSHGRRTSFPSPQLNHQNRFSTAGSSSIISLTWRRWVRGHDSSTHVGASTNSSRVDLEQGQQHFHHAAGTATPTAPTMREPSGADEMTLREREKHQPRGKGKFDDGGDADDDSDDESSGSSRATSSHGRGHEKEKAVEGDEKWRAIGSNRAAAPSEETVCPPPRTLTRDKKSEEM